MDQQREYSEKLKQELANYDAVEAVHDLPGIFHYWSNKYLLPKLQSFGLESLEDFFLSYISPRIAETSPATCEIVSLGAGNCDFEVGLATKLKEQGTPNFHFRCLELNDAMLQRGAQLAEEKGVADRVSFENCDLNTWAPAAPFDIALANHSLHHVVGLESVFDAVSSGLTKGGTFLINDMIGRNGHMRWPEALAPVTAFWKGMPRRYKYNHQLKRFEDEFVNWDCSLEGFEGIRAQDIMPELLKRFEFDFFLGFANVIDVFIDRSFGPNFDADNELDRKFIDRVHETDEALLKSGQIKPTHMLAALKVSGAQLKAYQNLTPKFCTRWPQESV
jgi:SAM-dependent methyltransferase